MFPAFVNFGCMHEISSSYYYIGANSASVGHFVLVGHFGIVGIYYAYYAITHN